MNFLGGNLTEMDDQSIFATFGVELENTQGYGLVGHGRKHVSLGLIRFRADADNRELLRQLAAWGGMRSTPALELRRTLIQYRDAGDDAAARREAKANAVVGVGLSINGFRKLHLSEEARDADFRKGFREVLGTTIPAQARQVDAFDATVVVASDDERQQLPQLRAEVNKSFSSTASVQWESGSRLPGNVDHFGYAEDIGQPVIFPTPDQYPLLRTSSWNPTASPNLVVVTEVGTEGEQEFGTYMAYLKIQQHINEYRDLVRQTVGATGRPAEQVQAWILGRAKNGEPLEPRGKAQDDFMYMEGSRCPVAAHIRKVNDRNHPGFRVTRRGVFFDDGEGKGALFQCFQSKLADGFLQLWSWALNDGFPETGAGQDPLLGERDWPPLPPGLTSPKGQSSVRRLTTVLHGEFFYFPSRPFFRRLIS